MKINSITIIIIVVIILVAGALYLYVNNGDDQYLNTTNNSNVDLIENININQVSNKNFNASDDLINNNFVIEKWTTVSSNIYDYQISIPEAWHWIVGNEKHNSNTDVPVTDISASPNQCYFNGNCITSSDILVTVQVSNMVCDSSDECANYLDYQPGCAVYSDRKNIKVDGYDATMQFEYPGEGCATESYYSAVVYLKKGDDTYKISGSTLSKEDFEDYSDVFNQIIKTIKY